MGNVNRFHPLHGMIHTLPWSDRILMIRHFGKKRHQLVANLPLFPSSLMLLDKVVVAIREFYTLSLSSYFLLLLNWPI
jgi:hypothetical protein